ncbi:YkgJ family cysteine cluster protein [Marinomonas sp. M1K-6]|uniref:YkgJ family cysteine cluster protein n=1 Tax=Marinomonas profundi TaxID=2726122 RepID=A0A847R0E9_9GAMM|nr:YkgJ family cysteine cluster protein [Marinomonas profundi]NLQ16935.1 YkgJ family cysteine cluster protein [Marinomonas profundi]UDV02664.1 YkgJ family cysteine cluster protein [Marinomonas profundi]
MQCRSGCGACCTAPSISSPIPGMPNGKAAGEVCIQLLSDYRCALFEDPSRPKVCADFRAEEYTCGHNREEAIALLSYMEDDTNPKHLLVITRTA